VGGGWPGGGVASTAGGADGVARGWSGGRHQVRREKGSHDPLTRDGSLGGPN
jgi:hypothetical protein